MKHVELGRRRVAALLIALALVVAACGDDDAGSGAGGGEAADAAAAETDPDAVCGEEASTDPAVLEAGRAVARCSAGAPAPEPLDERTEIRFATAVAGEFVAPLLLADSMGEFERENLDVEIVTLPFADAIAQMQAGNLDGSTGSLEASLYNAVASGIDLRWVAGNFFPPDAGDTDVPQSGLWVRNDVFSDPDDPDLAELDGAKFGSNVGFASATTYFMAEAFDGSGITPADLEVVQVPSADQVTALQNEAIDAAWLVDPFWISVADDPDFTLVATQTPGEPMGGFFFGPRLYEENREAGVAFLRAIIRTINTYLADDYQDDQDVVAAIAAATEAPEESILDTPPLVFDWEIREGSTDRSQEAFLALDRLEASEAVPEDELVDRSLYTDAVGAG